MAFRRSLIIALLLAGLTLATFWRVGGNGFISLDDGAYVTDNPWAMDGLTGKSIVWAFTSLGYNSNWHPLTWLSHLADVSLFGLDAGKHHLMSLSLHLVNTMLLFLVLQMMTGVTWPAAFVAALFALHPLHVESVAWIAERKDLLSTLFWFLTMGAYARYAHRPSPPRFLAVFLLLALGLLAKPMLVTLPFVLLLLDWWPLGRFAGGNRKGGFTAFVGRPLLEKMPLLGLTATSSIATYLAQERGGAVSLMERWHAPVRLDNVVFSYLRYLGKTIWPSGLSVYYPLQGRLSFPWFLAAVALLVAVTSLVVWGRKRYPFLAVGWFWYLGSLVPVIGVVRVGGQSFADRYTYIPLVGIFLAVAWSASRAARRGPRVKAVLGAVAIFALALLVPITWRQAGYWQDSLTLFGHALLVTADNHIASSNYGLALMKQGKSAEAIPYFRESARIMPVAGAFIDVGYALAESGRLPEAIENYQKALLLDPRSDVARFNIGSALHTLGRLPEAVAQYNESLRLRPDNAEAHNNLGVCLAGLGRSAEAADQFETATRLKPGYAGAFFNLGHVRALQGRPAEAAVSYEEVLRLDPSRADARLALDALRSAGRLP